MKTTFYVIGIIAFSALMLSPKLPKEYPPKTVLEQRREIAFKEAKIERIIDRIEYNMKVDSIHLENHKQ